MLRDEIGPPNILDAFKEIRVLWLCLVSRVFADEKVSSHIVDDYVKLFLSPCIRLHDLTKKQSKNTKQTSGKKKGKKKESTEEVVLKNATAFKTKLEKHQLLRKRISEGDSMQDCRDDKLKLVCLVQKLKNDPAIPKPHEELTMYAAYMVMRSCKPMSMEKYLLDIGYNGGLVTSVLEAKEKNFSS